MFNFGFSQHIKSILQIIAVLAVITPIVSGCNATKYLQDNEYTYKSSDVNFTGPLPKDVDSADLAAELVDLSKLEANEKLLGVFPLKTWLYMLGDTAIDHYIKYQEVYDTRFMFVFDYDTLLKKIKPLSNPESRLRNWLTNKAGEQPQFIDSIRIAETELRIGNYLYNRGYFNATESSSINYDQIKQTGKVTYHVEPGTLYRMKKVYYEIADKGLLFKINAIPTKSQLETGKPIDVDLLKAERNRLSDNLRNAGYYRFQKEYIYFEVDTASGTDSLDIYVRISNPVRDTVHHPFEVKNIYVYPNASIDYNLLEIPSFAKHFTDSTNVKRVSKQKTLQKYIRTDTTLAGKSMITQYHGDQINKNALLKYFIQNDSSSFKQFTVTNSGKLKRVKLKKLRSDYYLINSPDNYSAKSIANNIFINPESAYSDSLIQKTVASFSTLGMFKYVTVQAEEMWDSTSYLQFINLIIRLDPLEFKSVLYEINASTTSDYLLGNSINLSYTQKNLFHSLDQLKFNIKGGIETQLGGEQTFISTSELNTGLSLSLPRFMWPAPVDVPKRYFPKTDLKLNFNYVNQINDFTLYNTSFEYAVSVFETTKKNKAQKQHILKMPIPTVNIVRVPKISDAFLEELNQNPLLKQSFEEQVIMGLGYTFISNTQPTGFHVFDHYIRASAEVNAPFSDFIRLDADYRSYININKSNRIVSRASFGIATPYWWVKDSTNTFYTEVIPYVKQFFTGGAYSVRAFTVRKIGPGGYVNYDTTDYIRIDQVADLKLELNFEYRFDIISILEGAVFCDIGNTFTLKNDPFRPHAQFKINDFYKLMAVGPGLGLRLDFGYFVLRVDAAYPLYDPALDGPYRQEIYDYYNGIGFDIPAKKVAINLAIGYPF